MQSATLPARQRVAPVVTLLVLPPIIVEFLFGSTHISMLYLLIPQICVYGCGALLIRALVRYRGRSWFAILLLGLAFALTLECVILQTSFIPLPFALYGRALGVNWVYLLYQLGYESIWAIVLPIQLTELLFPDRRDDPWVGRRGLALASVVFLAAAVSTWYIWDQAVHRFVPGPGYQAPPATIIAAVAAVIGLFIVALGPWTATSARPPSTRPAPRLWLVRLVAFWLALLWFVLAIFSVGVAPALPAIVPIAAGLLLAASAFALLRRWSASAG